MSVSGVSSYRDVLFQWQGQQLKNTGTGSSSQSSTINALFSGNSITSQISSMVELTKYAMDAMGVDANGRVTFSQISKYSQQLQSEFNQGVRDGFANSGISDLSALTFKLDKNGALTAIGSNANDRKLAQQWLDANPDVGTKLLKSLKDADIELTDDISFSLDQNGNMTVVNPLENAVQDALDAKSSLVQNFLDGLKDLGVDLEGSVNLVFDGDGNLVVKGEHKDAGTINSWLAQNDDMAAALKKELSKNSISETAFSLGIGANGSALASVNDSELNDIQAVLDKQTDLGKKTYAALDDLGIDPNISFSIQINADGTLEIISDHPDRDKVQKFFEDNPELVKKYRQIDTLAGVDDARKAMQLSPSEMRKRIQIESMSAWWAGSGNSNSYFGAYNNGNLSLFAGLNLNV